jgi:hypothetical protein
MKRLLIKRLLQTSALLCLFYFLSSSQSNDKNQLAHYLRQGDPDTPLFVYWQAVLNDIDGAQNQLRNKALAVNAEYWLDKLSQFDEGETAWQRYQQSEQSEQRLGHEARWLRIAASKGVAKAQFLFALNQESPIKKEAWLLKSAEQGYIDAQIALSDWYLLNGFIQKAKPWLEEVAEHDLMSQVALAKILWNEQKIATAEGLFREAASKGSVEARQRLHVIDNYPILKKANLTANPIPETKFHQNCLQNILLVADGLSAMTRAVDIVAKFSKDTRLNNLGMCLSEPMWFEHTLDCTQSWQQGGRLSCNLAPLSNWLSSSAVTHLVVIGNSGKAYAQQGVMFLDAQDTYSVFVHELAHFAGFIDEYALSKQSANAYCGTIFATNIVFERDNGFLLDLSPKEQISLWANSESFEGLYPALTCDKSDVQALKPSGKVTFMEHHESEYIPPIYLWLWHQVLLESKGDKPLFRYLSTNNAVAPHTATGITTKLSKGTNEATLTHIPKERLRTRSSLSN